MLQDWQDAFGHEIRDYYHGKGGYEIVERDDGLFSISPGPELYFLEYEDWPESEREAMQYAAGKVLDVGCGAGRHSLYLQERGFDVLGIDSSPRAIEVCKARGLQNALVLSITQVTRHLGVFGTFLMLGNNFSLVGNPRRARWLLGRFHRMTSESGRIVAQTRDPYTTDMPEHLAYHEYNRRRGRMPGQARIRVRYKKYVTPWIEFLMLSKEELQAILDGTGWEAASFIDGQQGVYVAIMEKVTP